MSRETEIAYLEQIFDPNQESHILGTIQILPPKIADVGYALLNKNKNGELYEDWDSADIHPKCRARAKMFTVLHPAEQDLLLTIFFPKIYPFIRESLIRVPQKRYVTGQEGVRGFRAPQKLRWQSEQQLSQLLAVAQHMRGYYQQDILWVAEYCSLLVDQGWNAADLLATAIDLGGEIGDALFNKLTTIAAGDHPFVSEPDYAIRALLQANQPDGWEFVEQLLLNNQQNERVLQAILDSIPFAAPESFRRLVNLIETKNLVHSPAVLNGINAWVKINLDVTQKERGREVLTMFNRFLNDLDLAKQESWNEDPRTGHIALVAQGYSDVEPAVAQTGELLEKGSADQRLMAARFLTLTQCPPANKRLQELLAHDDDQHLIILAHNHFRHSRWGVEIDLYKTLRAIQPTLSTQSVSLPARIWPWFKLAYEPAQTDALLDVSYYERRSFYEPFGSNQSSYQQVKLMRHWFEKSSPDSWNKAIRHLTIDWIGDQSADVRTAAIDGLLNKMAIQPDEAIRLEHYLTRKASDLRKNVLSLLLTQADEAVLASAERLTGSRKIAQREAGLELMVKLFETGREANRCQQMAKAYREKAKKLSPTEQALLNQIPVDPEEEAEPVSLFDGLGLINHAKRTPPSMPLAQDFQSSTPTMVALIDSLIAWIDQHIDVEFEARDESGQKEIYTLRAIFSKGGDLLGVRDPDKGREENLELLALKGIWLTWWEEQQPLIANGDGFDVIRAFSALSCLQKGPRARKKTFKNLGEFIPEQYLNGWVMHLETLKHIFGWLIYLFPPPAEKDLFTFLLDGIEQTFYLLSKSNGNSDYWVRGPQPQRRLIPVGDCPPAYMWENGLTRIIEMHHEHMRGEHHIRLWQLKRWRDEPTWSISDPAGKEALTKQLLGERFENYTDMPRWRPFLDELMNAFVHGCANEDDILDHLVGPRRSDYKSGTKSASSYENLTPYVSLTRTSARNPDWLVGLHRNHPALQAAVERCRERILEVELQRGDLRTPATKMAKCLEYIEGSHRLISLARAFGSEPFLRGYSFDGAARKVLFSQLIRVTYPGSEETAGEFASLAKAAGITKERLIETAMYAPQWAKFVGHTLGWDGFDQAVWWFHAHTKETSWERNKAYHQAWTADVHEHTPLEAEALMLGAVDVGWFNRVYARLGDERWQQLNEAAKFASDTGGYKRAQLFADVMLGQVDQAEVVGRINEKRDPEAVRAYGLFPLPGKDREEELLRRYLFLQAFKKGSQNVGSQRRQSEALAFTIGLENMARAAGYNDPLRFEWAMEQEMVADLAAGPVSFMHDDVTVTLSINDLGNPKVNIEREKDGKIKPLKSVPAKLKKVPEIAALLSRSSAIKEQARRTRRSLENAMIQGDPLTGADLSALFQHPVLKPMIQQLLFIRESDGALGYPVMAGTELEGIELQITRLEPSNQLRIAHPHDLLSNSWHLWQRECFQRERIQPFKQIFRELYIVTEVEDGSTMSSRYQGQGVKRKQMAALFKQRGWVLGYESGPSKTYHDAGVAVHVTTKNSYISPDYISHDFIETLFFRKANSWEKIPLADVPPRLFSEAMRDIDLAISVAHLAGVTPLQTQSSIKMRANLARETAGLLKLDNIEVQKGHILIEGQLNNYSIHLGSGVIHQRPGGMLFVAPIRDIQRGRVFLPFIDEDFKAAEIISKMVMLAHDDKISDPSILKQLIRK